MSKTNKPTKAIVPLNLEKVKHISIEEMDYAKYVRVNRLNANSRRVSSCFHALSRIIDQSL